MRNTFLPPVSPRPFTPLPQPSEEGLAVLRREPQSLWRSLPRCEMPAETAQELASVLTRVVYPSRDWDRAIRGDGSVACSIAADELRAGPPYLSRLLDLAMSACLRHALMHSARCQAMLVHALVRTQGAGRGLMLAAGWDLVSLLTVPYVDRFGGIAPSAQPVFPADTSQVPRGRSHLRLVESADRAADDAETQL